MKKLLFLSLILFSLNLSSEQWQIMGTRPMGMGGAYVAMAKGPIAQYWNPAGLALISTQTFNGLEINAGIGIETTGGLLSNVSEVTDVSQQLDAVKQTQTSGQLDAQQMSAFVKTLGILSKINEKEDSGALLEVAGGLNLKFSKIALSVNNFTSVGLNPFIDAQNINVINSGSVGANIPYNTAPISDPTLQQAQQNLTDAITNMGGLSNIEKILCGGVSCLPGGITNESDLATALINSLSGADPNEVLKMSEEAKKYASDAKSVIDSITSGGSFDNNTSNINVKAASFTEFAAGYAKRADKWLAGLSVGGNIKLIRGQIGDKTFEFLNESETGDVFKNLDDNIKTSVKPALDVGFMWNVNDKYPKLPMKPKVGFTIRNINSPSFDGPNGKYKLDRQARLGLALSPFNWWHFALDIDITKNKTAVDGFYSRQLALGTEINILNKKSFNLPLRLGMMKNVAESDSKTVYTAGIGLTFAYIHIDAAVGISSGKQYIDGDKYPEKAQGVVSLGVLF